MNMNLQMPFYTVIIRDNFKTFYCKDLHLDSV